VTEDRELTSPSTILRALHQPEGTQCTRCGSLQVYPDPNPLAALAGFVHFARWYCRDCSGRFWVWAEGRLLRGRADRPGDADDLAEQEDADEFAEQEADGIGALDTKPYPTAMDADALAPDDFGPHALALDDLALEREEMPASAPVLDAVVGFEPTPTADLSALDAELARLHGTGPRTPRRKDRRKRASAS
jgi:hypothetical protein